MHPPGRGVPRSPVTVLLLALLLLAPAALPASAAGTGDTLVGYYFTGEGCPHCARVNPVLFGEWLGQYPDLVVVEYEVYGHRENAAVMAGYGVGLGIPVLFFGKNATYTGDVSILRDTPGFLDATLAGNGSRAGLTSLGSLDVAGLQGYPVVWAGDRVAIREEAGGENQVLKGFLSGGDPAALLLGTGYEDLGPLTAGHAGSEARFNASFRSGGWLFGWTGIAPAPTTQVPTVTPVTPITPVVTPTEASCPPPLELTATKIMALAAVNAINPCALAVLVVILLAIVTAHPGKRNQVLLAGLAFALSVFIFYLVYGLILVSLLSTVREASSFQFLLTRLLGLVSIVIGIFHIREYFNPGKNAPLTGIPRGWKPRLGKLLDGITTPWGAFIVGGLVTLFLLPCNIGPYIIGCGILAVYGPVVALPYLLLYNLVFILPMLIITVVVYLGVARIGDVKGWREENIGKFHLVSGIIILVFGVLLLFGWI